MKKQTFLISIVFLLLINSCSSDNEEIITTLKISEKELLFLAEENTKTVEITSNTEWEITEIPDWITIDKNEGRGDGKIILKARKNTKEEERSATLKIIAKEKQELLKIRQLSKNVTLAISKTEVGFDAEPTEIITFDIISNEAWKITEIPEWCTLSATSGDGDETISITVDKNYIDASRDAILDIIAGSKSAQLLVSQEALNVELSFSNLDLTSWYTGANLNFYEGAATQSIMIRSNTKWKVQSDVDWCIPDIEEGLDNQLLTIDISQNTKKVDRVTEIYITAGSRSIKILVQQSATMEGSNDPYEITAKDNSPRIGDSFSKKQIDYIDPGAAGEKVVWNFSNINVVRDKFRVSYDTPTFDNGVYIMGNERFTAKDYPANSLMVYLENNTTMYYYQLKDNLLQSIGHENPSVILHYNPRMLLELYPMKYNGYYKQEYESKGFYSGSVRIATEGYTEVSADGYGTIILPDGTFKNALRVKWKQIIKDVPLDGATIIGTPEEIEKGTRMLTLYKWYIKGYRYPVFETYRITYPYIDNKVVSSFAFYFPPKDQDYYLGNKETKSIMRRKLATKVINNISKDEKILPIFMTTR